MYEQFFGLDQRPFLSTPDPAGYFPTSSHEEALALLKCCVNDGEGVGVLSGRAGTGKTLLCHLLLTEIGPTHAPIFVANTHHGSVRSLLQAILFDLSMEYESLEEQELRLRLTQFLLERFYNGQHTLLFVDEAQNLSIDQLEELRLLTNLEGHGERAVQVLLIAQENLAEMLKDERLRAFRQRIAVYARLRSFTADETMDYIRHRIARAGGNADSIFTAAAISEIHLRSEGIPRRINQLCQRTLLLAFAHDIGTIDESDVIAAAAQLVSEVSIQSHPVEEHHPAPVFKGEEKPAKVDVEKPSVFEVGAGITRQAPRSRPTPVVEEPTVIEIESSDVVEPPGRSDRSRPTTSRSSSEKISRWGKMLNHRQAG